jgi:NADH:ubiquinone oxidoreductase subunit E
MNELIVEVCVGTSCHLLGSQDLMDMVESLPPAKRERIDLRAVTCLQRCRKGPAVRINGIVLSGMTPDRLQGVIDDNL